MLIYPELSYKIVGCCMDAHRKYGPHHNERIYHNVLKEQFDLTGIKYVSNPRINVHSRDTGKIIGFYIPDFLVDDKIIVEIKATPFNKKESEIQLLEYIKTTPLELAYLVNFGLPSLFFKRIIYTNDRKSFLINTK